MVFLALNVGNMKRQPLYEQRIQPENSVAGFHRISSKAFKIKSAGCRTQLVKDRKKTTFYLNDLLHVLNT